MDYVDFRCGKCGKLLGRIKGDAEIKCPRCSNMNLLTNQSINIASSTTSISRVLNESRTYRPA